MKSKLYRTLAWWLPDGLVYWTIIRAFAYTSRKYPQKPAIDLTYTELTDSWRAKWTGKK